ncbi:MAG: Gfo/Idh/MocA family oxidoreductase [Planctomycetaceae bacterium]
MPRSIGIGVIAMGWMGMTHSRAYQQIVHRFPQSDLVPRLVICADSEPDRTDEAVQRFGFERTTNDWRAVLADADVEVVSITAPNGLHREMCLAAFDAGKHVFCEKPVGRCPEETLEIAAAARNSGVHTFTGFCYRWSPVVQQLKRLIEDGRLGDLTHYRGRFFCGYGHNPHRVLSWRFQEEHAGFGVLGDLMSHTLDMALMLAGPVTEVVSQQETFTSERPLPSSTGTHFSEQSGGPVGAVSNEDYVGAMVRFAGGARGTLEACRVIAGSDCEHAFELNGTRGAARWNFERMNELELFLDDAHPDQPGYARLQTRPSYPHHADFNPGGSVGLGYEDLMTIEVHEFLRGVMENRSVEPGLDQMARVAAVQDAMARSWESRTWEAVAAVVVE